MNYQYTQKITDFSDGQLVRARTSPDAWGPTNLDPGAVYRVTKVNEREPGSGTGWLDVEGMESTGFAWSPAYGHLLFDPEVGDLRVGDRVKVTDKRTEVGDRYVGKTGTVRSADHDFDTFEIDFDDALLNSLGTWSLHALDLLPVTDKADSAPDLTDRDVRRGLPMMEAYPVGSVWNHVSSGSEPVTITGPDPDDDLRLMVHVPTYIGESPYEGSWVRGALDSYGWLVSLPGDKPYAADEPDFKADDTPDPQIGDFKVGDRVEVVGWDETWDGPATVVRIGTLYVSVDSDGKKMTGCFSPKHLRHLDDSEKADEIKVGDRVMVTEAAHMDHLLPMVATVITTTANWESVHGDLHPYEVRGEGFGSFYAKTVRLLTEADEPEIKVDEPEVEDAEIKVGDRVMVTEAFGVKSLPTPGTVTAVGGSQRFSQGGLHPYRVTPDEGTLAYSAEGYSGGMWAAKVEPLTETGELAEAQANIERLRADLAAQEKRAYDAVVERNSLTQAASDERRRLVAEIDALKIERDAALEDRALHKGRLKAAQKGLAQTVRETNEFNAALVYAKQMFLDEQENRRLGDYIMGWRDALTD